MAIALFNAFPPKYILLDSIQDNPIVSSSFGRSNNDNPSVKHIEHEALNKGWGRGGEAGWGEGG